MRKRIEIAALVGVIVAPIVFGAQGVTIDNRRAEAVEGPRPAALTVRAAAEPISVNGILTEWDDAASICVYPTHQAPYSDNEAVVKALWDYEKLYLAYRVTDKSLRARRTANDRPVWRDDCVEVYLSVRPHDAPAFHLGSDEYQFLVSINGTVGTVRGRSSPAKGVRPQYVYRDLRWDADFLSAVKLDGMLNDDAGADGGYVVEMAIPWSAIGYAPRAGDTLLADFCIEDADEGKRTVASFDWAQLMTFAVPYRWGQIVLEGRPHDYLLAMARARRERFSAAIAILLIVGLGGTAAGVAVTRRPSPAAAKAVVPETLEVVAAREETPTRTLARKAVEILRKRYAEELKLADVAAELFVTERTLQRALRGADDKTYRDYLTEIRLEKARELLESTGLSVTEICFEIGYRNLSHFVRAFRNCYHSSPLQYRKRHPATVAEPVRERPAKRLADTRTDIRKVA